MESRIVGVDAKNFEEACKKFMRGEFTEFKKSSDYDYCVKIDGNKTIVTDKNGNTAEAVCHVDDAFNVAAGFAVAVEKLNYANIELDIASKSLLEFLKATGVRQFYLEEKYIDYNDNVNEEPDDCADNCIGITDKMFKGLKRNKVYYVNALLKV